MWNGIAAGERGLTPVVNPIMQHEPVNRRWERGPPLSISDSPHLISRLSRTTFPLPRVPWVCTVHRFTAADRLVFSCGRSGRRPTAAPFPTRLVVPSCWNRWNAASHLLTLLSRTTFPLRVHHTAKEERVAAAPRLGVMRRGGSGRGVNPLRLVPPARRRGGAHTLRGRRAPWIDATHAARCCGCCSKWITSWRVWLCSSIDVFTQHWFRSFTAFRLRPHSLPHGGTHADDEVHV